MGLNTSSRTPWLLAALTALVVLGGCTQGEDDAASSATTTAPPTTTTIADEPEHNTTTTMAGADNEESAAPVEAQLEWLVEAMNASESLTEADVEDRFTAEFLAQVPAAELIATFPQLATLAEPPYSLESVELGPDGLGADGVLLGSDERRLSVQVVVEADPPYQIAGALLQPFELEFPQPIDVESIATRLDELGPNSALGVYDVTNGQCDAVHEIGAGDTIPLGSVFKLWVLGALAEEIDAGRASWDETLPVVDELRSSPDVNIYALETGTELTLQELAEAMISISDNTATDMLMDRLGRETVEAVLEPAGVADPDANIPLLSTGNLFSVKFVANETNAAEYRLLDPEGRRALLEQLDEDVLPWVTEGQTIQDLATSVNADGVALSEPRDLDIEWLATTEDLCRTHVYLDALSQRPGLEPVADILEINPGLEVFDRDRWPTVRFKGGSEPGVVAAAWWFEGAEGDRFVVAGAVANPDDAFNQLDAVLVLGSAIELIE